MADIVDIRSPKPIEFPKWVVPHPSHIATNAVGHQVPQGFDDFHFDRVAKRFTVLVKDAAEEARAKAAKPEQKPEPAAPAHDDGSEFSS